MANGASFLSPQFSQALAIRSYTKFVMGVSRASCPGLPCGLGGAEARRGQWRQVLVPGAGMVWRGWGGWELWRSGLSGFRLR